MVATTGILSNKVSRSDRGPAQARELLGPIEGWRWCLLHIRCCIIFGWLLCRRPRSFRLSAYYLYRLWLCVRQALGTPVTPGKLTDVERKDRSEERRVGKECRS